MQTNITQPGRKGKPPSIPYLVWAGDPEGGNLIKGHPLTGERLPVSAWWIGPEGRRSFRKGEGYRMDKAALPEIKKSFESWRKRNWRRGHKLESLERSVGWNLDNPSKAMLEGSDLKRVQNYLKKLEQQVEDRRNQERLEEALKDAKPTPGLEFLGFKEPEVLDDAYVEHLRKEFLMLMRNLKKITDPDTALEFSGYLEKWSNHFRESVTGPLYSYLEDITRSISRMERAGHPTPNKEWAEKYLKDIREIGSRFTFSLKEFPYNEANIRFYSKGRVWADYQEDKKKWENRTKKYARDLWKLLKSYAEWHKSTGFYGGLGEDARIERSQEVSYPMSGFKTVLVDYDPDKPGHKEALDQTERAFRSFRKRAAEVWPDILKYPGQIFIDFTATSSLGGVYQPLDRDRPGVVIYPFGQEESWIFHVIAHEVGHFMFRLYLSQGQIDAWSRALEEDRVEIDLRNLLDIWPEGQRLRSFIWDIEDPILKKQLEVFYHKEAPFDTREELIDFVLTEGPMYKVQGSPITGYAAINDEEAFADLIGLLFSKGPRSLPSKARMWLNKIFPRIKMASNMKRYAAQYIRKILKEARTIPIPKEVKSGKVTGDFARSFLNALKRDPKVEPDKEGFYSSYRDRRYLFPFREVIWLDIGVGSTKKHRPIVLSLVMSSNLDRTYYPPGKNKPSSTSSGSWIVGGSYSDARLGGSQFAVVGEEGIAFKINPKATLNNLIKYFDSFVRSLHSVLIHEFSHAADFSTRGTKQIHEEEGFAAYVNTREEMVAQLQEIVDQVLTRARKVRAEYMHTGEDWEWNLESLLSDGLNQSSAYRRIRDSLSRKNKNRVVKTVHRALVDAYPDLENLYYDDPEYWDHYEGPSKRIGPFQRYVTLFES